MPRTPEWKQRRIANTRSLDSGLSGDFEDPRRRGILQNTGCRLYREQLQSTYKCNILQGFILFIGLVTVLLMLSFHGNESTAINLEDQLSLEALWLGVSEVLGLGDRLEAKRSLQPFNCDQQLDTRRLFRQIGKQVLNQENALARLERAVRSKRSFKSVALLGPPGVGKTLTATELKQQFPWPENVHSYSWSTQVPDDAHKFHLMRQFVKQLSDCGQNLLIIDNLSTCDYSIVPIYNRLLQQREGDPRSAVNQTVLVVYIFSLQLEYYCEQFEWLQQLPTDTTIINYRHFSRDELRDCLRNELRLEQRILDELTLSLVLEEALLQVDDSGCKHIRQLLLQHGLFGQ
ncbi:GH16649 [Drosophila grimshawi]|uniref:GH16649 n=2 Tax=Drosophila grimshawi TaxID=7222 RepID=B4J2M7_DROGR|nr:GH16649 [Drosophila grimshawi]